MRKKREYGRFTKELRAEAVKAVREGTLSRTEVAEAFGISERSLWRWVAEAEAEEDAEPATAEEKAELRRLRKKSRSSARRTTS